MLRIEFSSENVNENAEMLNELATYLFAVLVFSLAIGGLSYWASIIVDKFRGR